MDLPDHRRLGRQLNIFATEEQCGSGLPFWLPDGATVRRELERFVVELERRHGYVNTPVMAKREVYEWSGASFSEADGEAAFYGPKLDFQVTDPQGREETLSTIQATFCSPSGSACGTRAAMGINGRSWCTARSSRPWSEWSPTSSRSTTVRCPPWLSPTQVLVLPARRLSSLRDQRQEPARGRRAARRVGRARLDPGRAHPQRTATEGPVPGGRRAA